MHFYLFLFVILLIIELLYFKIADKYNIIDKPNQRSSHKSITLRGGGIIFPLSVVLFFLIYKFQYPWFILGMMLILVVSFIDDIKGCSQKLRLIMQFTAMILMFMQWGLFINMPLWYIPLALIICVGVINIYNFMDGINGITGGYSTVVLLGLLWVDNQHMSSLIVTLLLSLLVFNFFNFRTKAKCFAGDVGSVSIAFAILFILGQTIISNHNLSYLIFLVVYGVDAVLTIAHRIMLHENILEPHRKHAYQILANELHWPHLAVASLYMFLQFIIIAIFYYIPLSLRGWFFLLCIIILSIVYIAFMKKYYHLHN